MLKELSLLLFILSFSYTCFAQDESSITGRWNVTSMQSNELMINFRTKEYKFKDTSRVNQKDPLQLKDFVDFAIQTIGSMYIQFNSDKSFKSFQGGRVLESGTYKFTDDKKAVVLTSAKKDPEIFSIRGKQLVSISDDEYDELVMVLEKENEP